jgi:GTP cyclohydrolase I
MALSRELKIPLLESEEFVPYSMVKYAHVLVVDDLIDSGKTRMDYAGFDFACIHRKDYLHKKGDGPSDLLNLTTKTYACYPHQKPEWIVYWWEKNEEDSVKDNVTRILQFIGEDPSREGLAETPARVIKSWNELFGGYKMDPKSVFKTFSDVKVSEMVLLKDIEFYSTCEHHMLPFFGKAHIAYLPRDCVIGVSKLARLLDIFSRRMQIQERIGDQVTTTLMDELRPLGAACIIEAQHFCMKARGVQKQDSIMVTSSLKGVFLEKPEARQELMSLIRL